MTEKLNGWSKLIGGILSAAVAIGMYVATLNAHAEKIQENKVCIAENAREIVKLKTDIAELKVYLRRLPEVEKKLDKLLERP